MQIAEGSLDVIEEADCVRQHNVVERTLDRRKERVVLGITDTKREIGLFASRPIDHLWAEIDADTNGRLQERQQITGAAADVEYARPDGN